MTLCEARRIEPKALRIIKIRLMKGQVLTTKTAV
jgi:hypothetical protein